MKPFTIVFTGGGSGGHVTPNLALIDYIKKIRPEVKIHYAGTNGIEKNLVTPDKAVYHEISAGRLVRGGKNIFKNLTVPFSLIKSVKQSSEILREIGADVVFSKGGYVALPVVIAAKKLGIRTIIHESDMTMGLANRISLRFADLALSTFPLPKTGVIAVGAPLDQRIYSAYKSRPKEIANIDYSKKVLLVTGGSLGATVLNEFVYKNFSKLTEKFSVILICGKGKKIDIPDGKNFCQIEYTDKLPRLFPAVDFCLTRGGSNTLCELTAVGVPFVCVPLTKSGRGEQRKNAEYLCSSGSGMILKEKDLNLNNFLYCLAKIKKVATKSVDGTKRISDYILGGCAKK